MPAAVPRTGRRFPLVPLAAGAIVAALLLAIPVMWAVVWSDGGRSAGSAGTLPGQKAQGNGKDTGNTVAGGQDGQSGTGGTGGNKGRTTAGPSASPTRSPATTVTPRARPTNSAGSRPGGGGTTVVKNPYTPEQVCNSGGHGSGYYRQRSSAFTGGSVYQLYNSSGYNCVVTLKTVDVGKKTNVWATLTRKDGQSATDNGAFAYYAGPVYLYAKGQCVKYRGGTGQTSAAAAWGNCG
jgi:hypothetical protein